jgi:Abortive infection C-terminus
MRKRIPSYIIAMLSEACAESESHASLDRLFMYAGAPGDPPLGSRSLKVQDWLRRVNEARDIDPLQVLGRLIEGYMDNELSEDEKRREQELRRRERIAKQLARASFQYFTGGRIVDGLASPTRSLEALIRGRDLDSLQMEFNRALENVAASPREAVSAACNVLEGTFKIYIEDEKLESPAKQDLSGLWGVVRKHLGFDPSLVQDDDLRKILSGMIGTVDGIGAFRTHASSAHGAGRKRYKVQPRHARLAVHAAHTITAFVLETWDARKSKS